MVTYVAADPDPASQDPVPQDPAPSRGSTQYRYLRALVIARGRVRRAWRDPDAYLRETYEEFRARHPLLAWTWSLLHLDFAGLFVGGAFLIISGTVSLLPRSWFFQGVVAGISSVIGYGIGVLLRWFIVEVLVRSHPIRERPALARWIPPVRLLIASGVVIGGLVMLLVARRWQNQLRELMGMPPEVGAWFLLTPVVAFLISAALISVFRVLRDLIAFLAREANKYLRIPRPAARLAAFMLVVAACGFAVNDVGARAFRATANSIASTANSDISPDYPQPQQSERSGSPESLVKWTGLGSEGRQFTSTGLRAAQLRRFVNGPVMEPIRAYVGLDNAPTEPAREDLLRRELARTHALDRSYVVVIPTTGSGWVNPTAARALELMYHGDVALIASQYSYLPSWISFVTDRDASLQAGKQLIDLVRSEVLKRPVGQRPKLLVMGESLGTRAGEGAFDSLADIRGKVDGVVWIGPPRANPLHSAITARRDPGSPEVLPTYADGLVVRFTDGITPLRPDGSQWLHPHIVYVQHASDPVVWWDTDLILRQPDWLRERPGRDRSPAMAWYPFVTFWQVSADLANAAGVPDGHGHNYGTAVVDAFAAVMPPPGWSAADTERVRVAVMASADLDGAEK
jgi:uncharacterized membrane protein